MLIYTTNVANAMNKYSKYFGVRIRYPDLRSFRTEKEFCHAVDDAIKTKNAVFGGKWHKPAKPESYVRPPKITEAEVDQILHIIPADATPVKKSRSSGKKAAASRKETVLAEIKEKTDAKAPVTAVKKTAKAPAGSNAGKSVKTPTSAKGEKSVTSSTVKKQTGEVKTARRKSSGHLLGH